MKALISLVGGRPLPNILVALHTNPDVAYFIVSKDSVGPGRDYEKTLDALPTRFKPQDYKVVAPYSIEESIAACKEYAEMHPDAEIVFNATLGPKTMAFGVYEVAKTLQRLGRKVDVCYLGNNGLVWVFKGVTEPTTIGLNHYFESYGWKITYKGLSPASEFDALVRLLLENIHLAPQLLRTLRNCDRGKGTRTVLCKERLPDDQFALLKEVEGLGYVVNVQRDDQSTKWTFPTDEKAQSLLSGDWLEYHTYLIAKSLMHKDKTAFSECGWAVEDVNKKGEIDFVGITGGQLVIASCKTEPSIERKWLEELYGRAEQLGKGMCSTILVSTVSRASRSQEDLETYSRWANDRQSVIVFAEDIPRLGLILKKIASNDKSSEPEDIHLYSRI